MQAVAVRWTQSASLVAVHQLQKPVAGGEELLMRSGLIVGNIYMIKAFTWRFVLDTSKFGKFHLLLKSMAMVDVHGCVITSRRYTLLYYVAYKVYQWCDIHTGVGFCVARSDSNGQYQSLEVWNE